MNSSQTAVRLRPRGGRPTPQRRSSWNARSATSVDWMVEREYKQWQSGHGPSQPAPTRHCASDRVIGEIGGSFEPDARARSLEAVRRATARRVGGFWIRSGRGAASLAGSPSRRRWPQSRLERQERLAMECSILVACNYIRWCWTWVGLLCRHPWRLRLVLILPNRRSGKAREELRANVADP